MLRRKCASSQLTDSSAADTALDVHDGQDSDETSFDEAVSAFVEGIISNAVQTLQQEVWRSKVKVHIGERHLPAEDRSTPEECVNGTVVISL